MYFKTLLLSFLAFCTIYTTTAQKRSTKQSDLFTSSTGKTITTSADWEQIRKPELFQQLEEQLFGIAPSVTVNLPNDFTNVRDKFLNGKASMKEITIHLTFEQKTLDVNVLLFIPNKVKENIPVIVGLNEFGNHTLYPEETFSMAEGWVPNDALMGVTDNKASKLSRGIYLERWPILNIINRGYGLALVYCGDIDPDFHDGFKNKAHAFLPSTDGDKAWGTIAAWSWGIRQVIEFFRYMPSVNKENVIVAGNGKLGVAALWAAAQDNRIGLVIGQNTDLDQTISRASLKQNPHWFANSYKELISKQINIPFGQQFLLSLIAPRPIYLASTYDAKKADAKREFEAATQATPTYLLYNRLGLEQKEFPSNGVVNHNGYIAYHIRKGSPDFTIYDWERFLDYADLLYKAN